MYSVYGTQKGTFFLLVGSTEVTHFFGNSGIFLDSIGFVNTASGVNGGLKARIDGAAYT